MLAGGLAVITSVGVDGLPKLVVESMPVFELLPGAHRVILYVRFVDVVAFVANHAPRAEVRCVIPGVHVGPVDRQPGARRQRGLVLRGDFGRSTIEGVVVSCAWPVAVES